MRLPLIALRLPLIALAIVAALGALYFNLKPAVPGVHLPATPAPELKREETVPVLVAEPIQVYRPAVKAKLDLPPAVQADAKQHVVASTKTPNDERSHTVTTTLDTSTGEFTSYDRAEPLPWLAVSTKSQVGVYYGLKRGEQAIRLEWRQELLQIKALRIESIASADIVPSDVDTFVGIGVSARW